MFESDCVVQGTESLAISFGESVVIRVPFAGDDVVISRCRPEVRIEVADDPQEVIDFAVVVGKIPGVPLDQVPDAEDGVGSEETRSSIARSR